MAVRPLRLTSNTVVDRKELEGLRGEEYIQTS
jgi:hypothetical protein